jgi:hypothetical protein
MRNVGLIVITPPPFLANRYGVRSLPHPPLPDHVLAVVARDRKRHFIVVVSASRTGKS